MFPGLTGFHAAPQFNFLATTDPTGFSSSSFTTFSSCGEFSNSLASSSPAVNSNGAGVAIKRTTTSTRFDETGRRIETRKVIENGVETVTVHENGQLVSRTVNGVPQALTMA